MAEITCRPAGIDDAADILAVLLRVAPEIPLATETLEREEALYALIRNCTRSGESWVAEDAGRRIVGFIIAETNQRGRHYAEHEALELHYAGVLPEHRGHGVFSRLIAEVIARLVAVTTTVSPRNRSAMAARLERLGFRPTDTAGSEVRYRWLPGRP